MGAFDEFITKHGTDLDEALGNVEDNRIRTSTFEEAMKQLDEKQQDKTNTKRYWDIVNRMGSIDYATLPTTKKSSYVDFDPEHPDFQLPDKSSNEAIKQYNAYLQAFSETNDDGTPKYSGKALNMKDYFEKYPSLKEYLDEGHFKTFEKEEEISTDELRDAAYQSAGLTPDDVAFYDERKNKIETINAYNQKIKRMVAGMYPRLVSKKGKVGDFYAKMFGQTADEMQLNQPEPVKQKVKYEYKDGKLIAINENTGSVKVTDVEKKPKTKMSDWEIFTDEDGSKTGTVGTPFLGERVPQEDGSYKIVYRDKLNAQELKEFNRKEETADNRLEKSNKLPGRKRLGSNGPKHRDFGNMTPEEIKKLSVTDINNMDVTELNTLKGDNYKGLLSDEQKNAIKSRLKNEEDSPVNERDDKRGELYGDDRTQIYIKNIDGAIAEIIKSWGRDDLTVEEWTDQLSKYQFSPEEKEILNDVYGISL